MSIDSIDGLLSKKGFTFWKTFSHDNDASSVVWKNKNFDIIGVLFTPDTITTRTEEGIHTGYVDVVKKAVTHMSTNPIVYNLLLADVKAKNFKKKVSYAQDASLNITYSNDRWIVLFSKSTHEGEFYYNVRIDDQQHEVGEYHIHINESDIQ